MLCSEWTESTQIWGAVHWEQWLRKAMAMPSPVAAGCEAPLHNFESANTLCL